jgi:hypothetical protein
LIQVNARDSNPVLVRAPRRARVGRRTLPKGTAPPATAEINNGQITHIPGELGVWVFILGDMGVFTETCQK